MDEEKSHLNPSSLLDLKAELHKKYDSFRKAKLSQNANPNRQTKFQLKGEPISKDKKAISKIISNSGIENNEEELALKKSRLALEAKAKFYDKITSNKILIDDEDNDRYEVDFHRKVLYETPVPEKSKDVKNSSVDSEENCKDSHSSKLPKDIYNEKPVMFNYLSDKRTEENQTDEPIHYQNIQFNEVRDHGTGYFAFSMDESKRKEQMEELNRLRKQTEENRLYSQRMQRKRKSMLETRLAKVCERRNIDKNVVQTYTKTEESEDPNLDNVDVSSIPLPETPEVSIKKETKIRPWDIGKTDFVTFVPEKTKIKSQNDWIKERRTERLPEFAPSYY